MNNQRGECPGKSPANSHSANFWSKNVSSVPWLPFLHLDNILVF
jgi:hypothetical protein